MSTSYAAERVVSSGTLTALSVRLHYIRLVLERQAAALTNGSINSYWSIVIGGDIVTD